MHIKRGFVFTLDVALAGIIAVLFFVAIVNVTAGSIPSHSTSKQLVYLGNDFITVLELNKTFDNYVNKDQSFVSNDLQSHFSTLPLMICANVVVSTYDFSGGSFIADDVYNVTKTNCTASLQIETAKAKRVFITFDPEKYGKIEISMWLK